MAVVGGAAVIVIGQQGGGRVSTDDELQAVRRLCDQRDDEAAVKVSGSDVVNLKDRNFRLPLLPGRRNQVWCFLTCSIRS